MVDKADHEAGLSDIRIEVEAEIQADEANLGLGDLEPLDEEVEMDEVYLDEAELEAIASDNTDDDLDGVADDEDDEAISDLPQDQTESYGTGLQGAPSDRAGRRMANPTSASGATLTGGDIDANYDDADAVGDEAVGGSVMTPDQDVVDEIGAAVGLEMDDGVFLRTNDILEERDDRRWELDPKSSEDYGDRRE